MKMCTFLQWVVFAIALGVTGCGDEGGSTGTGGSAAMGGGGDCARIAGAPVWARSCPRGLSTTA
jgi:hypothetical protein